jgi:pyridoxamine 5'-phosphate oxidase
MDIGNIRRDYGHLGELHRKDLDPDPIKQFDHWFEQANNSDILDPSAMSLATASSDGDVGLRTVLLKLYDQNGFIFFTNYSSEKARHISQNPKVALLFPWLRLDRQVKICGTASRIPASESLRYFLTRPRGSQIGAWVSQQSSVISSRELLLSKLEEIKNRFADGDISLPEFWGGYRVVPHSIEFWQGQKDRLHDRFRYRLEGDQRWIIERLAP